MSPPTELSATPRPDAEQQALLDALAGVLTPLARLAVARGLPYAAVEELLKLAFVQAADQAHPGLLPHRKVSRIATATGINRREVTRLTQQAPRVAEHSRSHAAELFAHWRGQPPYRGADGQPRELPRQGPAPSFETLAQAITRDVHPRSLLDELVRLGLARWDEASDCVSLLREVFVPQGDAARQLGFLGANVGDHLRAAVDNVVLGDRRQFEQALFADGLSAASIEAVKPLIGTQWTALLGALVPVLEGFVERDAAAPEAAGGRIRIGLYAYDEGAAPTPEAGPAPTPAPRVRRRTS